MVAWLSEATNSMASSPSVVSLLVADGSLFSSTLSDNVMPLSETELLYHSLKKLPKKPSKLERWPKWFKSYTSGAGTRVLEKPVPSHLSLWRILRRLDVDI